MKKRTKVKIALGLVSLAGLYCFYWLCFSVWMTAYPFVNNNSWRIRAYWWFFSCLALATAWIISLVWLMREKRRNSQIKS